MSYEVWTAGDPPERNYCLVPDCDEQPYPGDLLCETHEREDRYRNAEVERWLRALMAASPLIARDRQER